MALVAVTPGTPEASDVAELLSWPDPVGVTIRSALMAWSALLVADRDTEAPNTDIAATRARPTMSAEAVCAVRRGLRIEFSRPSLPGSPSTRASGRPITLDSGGGGRLGQPDGQQDDAGQAQRRAADEPAPQRRGGARPAVIERGHRRDPH